MKVAMATRSTDLQRRAREEHVDTKKIQELERHPPPSHRHLRQVRELEGPQRNRRPSSPPALIPTAATADGQGGADAGADAGAAKNCAPSRIDVLLELKVQRLEAELENHNQEAKRSYQAMEQHFHAVKVEANRLD